MILVFWTLRFKPTFPLSSFTFIKRLFSSSSLSAIRVVSSAYLRLLICLLATLIPAYVSSSLAFCMMYSYIISSVTIYSIMTIKVWIHLYAKMSCIEFWVTVVISRQKTVKLEKDLSSRGKGEEAAIPRMSLKELNLSSMTGWLWPWGLYPHVFQVKSNTWKPPFSFLFPFTCHARQQEIILFNIVSYREDHKESWENFFHDASRL